MIDIMHKIYHGYCRSVWEASQHPDYRELSLKKIKVNRDIPLALLIQKVSGKLFWTLEHFFDHFTLNKTRFYDVSPILNSHLHWTPSLPPILNELRIADFPELLMSSLNDLVGKH